VNTSTLRLLPALALSLAACGSAWHRAPKFGSNDDAVQRRYQRTAAANRLASQRRDREASELARKVLSDDPLFVPAWRVRQNVQRRRGRVGVAWHEVQELCARFPDRPEPIYLRSRLITTFTEKQAMVLAALKRYPNSYWLRYALAWCALQRDDRAQARQLLDPLLNSPFPFTDPWILYRHAQESPAAVLATLPRLTRWAKRFPGDGYVAALRYEAGDVRVRLLEDAMRNTPDSRDLARLLRLEKLPAVHRRAIVRACIARPKMTERLIREGRGLRLAELALADGEQEAAEHWLEVSLAGNQPGPMHYGGIVERRAMRELIRLKVRRGDLESAIALYESKLPRALILGGDNLIGARMAALLEGPCRGVSGPPRDLEQAVTCLDVLLEAGWVSEAELLGRYYSGFFPDAAPLARRLSRARRFLRFEAALVDVMERYRREVAAGRGAHLDELFDRLRARSMEELGTDVVGKPAVLKFGTIGMELVDPFGPGLPEWFRSYNRHLLLGRGLGEGFELVVGQKLFERRLPPDPRLPLAGECREVLVESKEILSTSSGTLNDPAGVALWNHYLLDLQSMLKWRYDLLEVERLLVEEGIDNVLADPFPAAGRTSMSRPCQVDRKLIARYKQARPGVDLADEVWGSLLTLLRLHERAHLVEAHRYLPVLSHLGPSIALFVGAGLSSTNLLAGAEGRAECAALAFGADPRLVLSHLAGFLVDPSGPNEGPHTRGFREILRRLVTHWAEDGAPGAEQPENNLLAQLYLMPEQLAVRYAHEIMKEEGW